MAEQSVPRRPVPAPRPDPKLDNWIYGPPAGRLETWLLNGLIVLAALAIGAGMIVAILARTCGIGVVC